jgi:Arc/MetJ-type ribon-helix-helix transcriptional regulator
VRKSKSTDPDYVRTTVYLPKQLHKQLKAAAADEEREMSDIVKELVEQWLKSRSEHSDV